MLKDEPAWERLPELHPAVADMLRSCLSKERVGRPATLDEARRVLEDARLRSTGRHALAARPRHSLPAERDALVGRESELTELGGLLRAGHRLVSVLGIGGMG